MKIRPSPLYAILGCITLCCESLHYAKCLLLVGLSIEYVTLQGERGLRKCDSL